MIKNLLPDPRFSEELSIISFEDTQKVQFESYCRANYYQIIWIKEGSAVFEIDMKKVNLTSDQCVCIGKDLVYKFDSSKNYTGYIISFVEHYFEKCGCDRLFLEGARVFKEQHQSLFVADIIKGIELLGIEHMMSIYLDNSNPLNADIVHTLLKLFLYRAEATFLKTGKTILASDPNKILVNKFKHLVNEHFIEHKDIVFYTEQLGVSSRQLLYATKQVLGRNAKEVIIEKIIIEGKRFLTYSGLSVKQIAYCLGFQEPNNFSIFFNKYTGLTPLAYKKNIVDTSSSKVQKFSVDGHQ